MVGIARRTMVGWPLRAVALMVLIATGSAAAATGSFANDPQVKAFAEALAAREHVPSAQLLDILDQARRVPAVITRMRAPAEALPWYRYRAIFLTPARVRAGVAFWNAHRDVLERAARRYGVPAQVVVAIIGVESFYGRHTGSTRVLDALATLAFDYPPRARFFRDELGQFLMLAREDHLDPLEVKGSYAGAMGMPQFIASSYRTYAVDFNGDGKTDLIGSAADAIGSVANYLARHGWVRDGAIAMRARVKGDVQAILAKGNKPVMTVAALEAAGVHAQGHPPSGEAAALIALRGQRRLHYWLGFANFYAITRYNHSNLYAMAVTQLAQAIHHAVTEPVEVEGH